jgi:hypothetical protein
MNKGNSEKKQPESRLPAGKTQELFWKIPAYGQIG